MATTEPTPENVTQELYKRNAELAVRNKTLSLLGKLYEISILTLEPASLAERITHAVQIELDFNLVGIFHYAEQTDSLTPLYFAKSQRLERALGEVNAAFDGIQITKTSSHSLFAPFFTGGDASYTEDPAAIWDGMLSRKALEALKTEGHLRTLLAYPLVIDNRKMLGVCVIGVNRAHQELGEFEKESIRSFVNVIAIALNKALLYEELQILNKKLFAANDDLNQANEKLKEFDKQKSEFVSMAGHQLRAPLTVIKGYTSLLIEGTIRGTTPAAREVLQKVAFSAEQLVKLVGGLLDLSRIEAGEIKYEMVQADLAKVASEVIDKFKVGAEQKGLGITFENKAGAAVFTFDQDKIREAVVNYLDNAVKYSEKGTVVVGLDRVGAGADARMRLSVKDTGLGIKPGDLQNLFAKFSRTEEAKKLHPDGMGIGLYFVKRIVEDHGGAVGAASEGIGKGSTFWFELPMKTEG